MSKQQQRVEPRLLTHGQPDTALGGIQGRERRGQEGFIAIELVLVTLVMLVALQIFAEIMLATSRQRSVNRENSIAMEASRATVEHLMSLPLQDIFALYNSNPNDDPGGVGTAPGPKFKVPGLTPASFALDGMQGSVSFPVGPPPGGAGGGAGGFGGVGGLGGAGGTGGTGGAAMVLREDVVDRDLGMPRDLNGDLVVDDLDHSNDYSILPVRLQITWHSRSGDRSLSQHVLLTEMGL